MSKKYYIFISFIVFTILSVAFFITSLYSNTASATCSYIGGIQQCFAENFPEGGGLWFPESIEDFVCLQSNNKEEIVYQIVLDKNFKEIDDKIEEYLSGLELEKDKYFWENKSESFLNWIQQIYDDFGEKGPYYKEYLDLCDPKKWLEDTILTESIACLDWEISNLWWKNFFVDSYCMSLAITKLDIYKEVAVDIMKTNKHEIRVDDRKTHTQKQREKYDSVLDLFRINLSYMERIWKKWVSKTKNPH